MEQLFTIEVLDMTLIATTEYRYCPRLSPRSILVFSGGYHVISNTPVVNNCCNYVFHRAIITNYQETNHNWSSVMYRTYTMKPYPMTIIILKVGKLIYYTLRCLRTVCADLYDGIQWSTTVFFPKNVSIKMVLLLYWVLNEQGPVVQSVVSLTSSLRVISLTVLADSI